jgi:hypothetical protein
MSTTLNMKEIKKLESAGGVFSSTACRDPNMILPADEETSAFLEDWKVYQAAVRQFKAKYPWLAI